MVVSQMYMKQFQVKIHWMLLWTFIVFGINAFFNKCSSSKSDEEVWSVNIEFEKSYSYLTGKPVEETTLSSIYKWQNENNELLGIIMVLQGFWLFLIITFYWYAQSKLIYIFPETKVMFDTIFEKWKTMERYTYKSREHGFSYNRLCFASLGIHRNHIKSLKIYIAAETALLCTSIVNICISVQSHVFINKTITGSGHLWAYHETVTASSYPEIKCFLNHLSTMQYAFALVYFGYLLINVVIIINLYSPVKYYILYKIEKRKSKITVVCTMLKDKPDLTPTYFEFILLKHIQKIGDPKLLCHVERNIFNDRYNVFKNYNLY